MTAPCVICGKACGAFPDWPAVLTVIGRFCSPCYQAGREPEASTPGDLRTFRSGARGLGLRVAGATAAGGRG